MKTKVLFICMAALLFVGCKPTTQPFIPVEVECEVLFMKSLSELGVTTPAAAEVRIINSVADFLPLETEFMIGDAGSVDTLKRPISEIDFTTQQIVVLLNERVIQDFPFFIELDKIIEYENFVEISIWQRGSTAMRGTGRSVMFILMPKTSKNITAQYKDWSGTDW